MNRTQIMKSTGMIEHFCKSYDLPIAVFEEPYFGERLFTVSLIVDCIDDYEDFCEDMMFFKDENDVERWYDRIREQVLHSIKMTDGYLDFSQENFSLPTKLNQIDLYSPRNDGKTFISIKMESPYYNSLKHYNPYIFGTSKSWEDFIESFTDIGYISRSKEFERSVLSECCATKQITYIRKIMLDLAAYLRNKFPSIDTIYEEAPEELLIEVEGSMGYSLNDLNQAIQEYPDNIHKYIKTDIFEIKKIKNERGYVKTYLSNKYIPVFVDTDPIILPQLIKHWFREPVEESDLVGSYNGRLIKFVKPIQNPWG